MGEKKRRLAVGAASAQRFDERLIGRALHALERGDRRGAELAFEALQTSAQSASQLASSSEPEALHAVGVIALRLERNDAALTLLDRAIAIDGGNPASRCHRAIAYRRLGDADRAVADLEIALKIDPRLAEAHSNLGNLLFARRQTAAASASFQRALELRARYPEALNGLGECLLEEGRYEEACASFERALSLDPAFHEAAYNRSRAHALWGGFAADGGAASPAGDSTHAELALEGILVALQQNRDNPAYWMQFERCVTHFDLRHPVDPLLHDLLASALAHPAVEPARLAQPIISRFITHPDVAAVERDVDGGGFDATDAERLTPAARLVCGDPLMQQLLEDVVVPNPIIERLLGFARAELLRRVAETLEEPPFLPLPAIVAIANHGFNGEYVTDETDEERALLARLAQTIAAVRAAGASVPLHAYATYACYRPLGELESADAIAAELAATALGPLALRQIVEPRDERRIRDSIVALTEVADDVSAAVRDQYEERPYPRWQRLRAGPGWPSVGSMLRQWYPEARLDGVADGPARILVAGCGTGRHPIGTARRFPDSSVLAVDLSLASLAYAVRKTRELGLPNIEYRQADLLALSGPGGSFDSIECAGVLHHLADPLAGWRTLVSLLRPGGVMRIGLYSEIARAHVVRARELVASGGYAPTPEGLRAFRRAVLARADEPLCTRLARGEDFYSLSGVRDLAFHVREHRFTLPQIAAMISGLGLEFMGFELPDPGIAPLYRDRFPGDSSLSDLGNWHALEQERPDTFVQMYVFWVHKPLSPSG